MADNFNDRDGLNSRPRVQRVMDTDVDERPRTSNGQPPRRPASSRPQGQRRPSGEYPQGARRPAPSQSSGSGAPRRPQGQPQRPAAHRRKRKSNFKKGLLAYAAILVIIIIVGAILFSSYLGAYEKSRPYVAASKVAESFSSADGINKFFAENADKTDVMGDVSSVLSSYSSNIVGKQISYVQNADFRNDAPSYNITADGKVVAQVVLGHQGSSGWGFDGWGVSKINIAKYLPDMTQYTVLVPQGTTVYLNGEALDPSYISDSGVPKVLRNVTQYLKEVPTYDTYTVPSMNEPSFTAKDAAGNDIALVKSDTTFSATTTDQAFIDEVYPNTEATLDTFAKYFIHESFNLSAYMLPGTPYYVAIFGDDETYGIDTSLYNFEHIVDYGFDEKEIKNFVKYTDDCYTVDVKYHMYVTFDEDRFSDNDQALDATWVFVYDQDKADWFLADSQNH